MASFLITLHSLPREGKEIHELVQSAEAGA